MPGLLICFACFSRKSHPDEGYTMSVAGSHNVQLRTPSRFYLVITILNIVIVLLTTMESSRAADLIWLSCSFQNARSTRSEAEEQIYAFNEKEKNYGVTNLPSINWLLLKIHKLNEI